MSWWENIEGYQLGDIVADMFMDVAKEIKTKHSDITLQDFLRAMIESSNASAALVDDANLLPITKVTARLSDKAQTVVEPSYVTLADVVSLLKEGFASTSFIFEETFNRKPKLGEIYANLNFVLLSGSEYFSFPPDVSILYFKAE